MLATAPNFLAALFGPLRALSGAREGPPTRAIGDAIEGPYPWALRSKSGAPLVDLPNLQRPMEDIAVLRGAIGVRLKQKGHETKMYLPRAALTRRWIMILPSFVSSSAAPMPRPAVSERLDQRRRLVLVEHAADRSIGHERRGGRKSEFSAVFRGSHPGRASIKA
jgi:hypothetical protein